MSEYVCWMKQRRHSITKHKAAIVIIAPVEIDEVAANSSPIKVPRLG